MGYLNSDRIQVDGVYNTVNNYVGLSASYSNQTTLTPQFYDYNLGGGEIEFNAEPSNTDSSPMLIIAIGTVPKVVGTTQIFGGGRTNSPSNANWRSIHGRWCWHTYHEGDGDGFTHSLVQSNMWNTDLGFLTSASSEMYNSGHTPPANRDYYWFYQKYQLTNWQGQMLRIKLDFIKGAQYTVKAFWE